MYLISISSHVFMDYFIAKEQKYITGLTDLEASCATQFTELKLTPAGSQGFSNGSPLRKGEPAKCLRRIEIRMV